MLTLNPVQSINCDEATRPALFRAFSRLQRPFFVQHVQGGWPKWRKSTKYSITKISRASDVITRGLLLLLGVALFPMRFPILHQGAVAYQAAIPWIYNERESPRIRWNIGLSNFSWFPVTRQIYCNIVSGNSPWRSVSRCLGKIETCEIAKCRYISRSLYF